MDYLKKINEISSCRLRQECLYYNIDPSGMSRNEMIIDLQNKGLYEIDTRFPAKPKPIDTSDRSDDLTNVFIGNGAGKGVQCSNKLFIANSSTHTPLVGGDFKKKVVNVNDVLNIGNTYDFGIDTPGEQGDIRRLYNDLYMYKKGDNETYEGWYPFTFGSVLII